MPQNAKDDSNKGQQDNDKPKYDPSDLDEAKKIISALLKRVDEKVEANSSLKETVSQMTERMTALETAQRDKLEQDGNFQELAQQRLAEIETLKPMAERSKVLDQLVRDSNAERMAKLSDAAKELVIDLSPEKLQAWLNKAGNIDLLTKAPAPDFDAGTGGGSGQSTSKLTSDEIEAGNLMGVSEEEMLKVKEQNKQE